MSTLDTADRTAAARSSGRRRHAEIGRLTVGDRESGVQTGVQCQKAERGGVADDRDTGSAGEWLAGEQRCDVERLAEGLGADHPGLLEQGRDRSVGNRSGVDPQALRRPVRAVPT